VRVESIDRKGSAVKTFVVLLLVALTFMMTFAVAGPVAQSPFRSAADSGLIDGRGLG
jgi:hypothetical protein